MSNNDARRTIKRKNSMRNSLRSLNHIFVPTDLKTHPLFCEISEILTNHKIKKELWKETARLVKYIETIDGSGNWSKPHVSTVSLHNLGDLRAAFENGTILFNCEETDFDSIIDKLISDLIEDGNLDSSNSEKLRETLTLTHIHQYQKQFTKELNHGKKMHVVKKKEQKNIDVHDVVHDTIPEMPLRKSLLSETSIDGEEIDYHDSGSFESYDSDLEDHLKEQAKSGNMAFRKKVPEDAHAANFMVGTVDYLTEELITLVELARPTVFENLCELNIPTKYLFIALSPPKGLYKMRQIGRCCATLFSDEIFQSDLQSMRNVNDLVTAFDSFLDQATVIPPGEWDTTIRLEPPSKVPSKAERMFYKKTKKVKVINSKYGGHEFDPCLERTGKFGGGLFGDIKRKIKWYRSDFTDAFNFQCIPVIGFLYFACLTPIVTFGGLLGYATDNNMGAIESLVAGLCCGVAYSLLSGQPMTILGSTGPVLVFETILNTFSKANGIDYMGFRAYVGLWICFLLIIMVFTDMSFLVQYITKFTEELFAILIAIIFVHESLDKLLKIRKTHNYNTNPFDYAKSFNANETGCFRCVKSINGNVTEYVEDIVNAQKCESLGNEYKFLTDCQNIPDVFFFSVILYMSTFLMAIMLRSLRFSSFFSHGIRMKISNFGVVATICTMVAVDYKMGLDTPKLHVPSTFVPTIADRGWFINPVERAGDKWWLAIAAIIPALLATILIFMDQQITSVIVNRESNKLKKSAGYHLDLLIVAIMIGVNSLFGLPWFVAATVLSMNHVIALRKTSESSVPGEPVKMIGVIEQRVTGCVIFTLIGCSIFVTKYLSLIPMPVLYAVFMYMGVTPMGELDFFQRILLLLMPKKHQPDHVFTRYVRLFRVNLFTFIQITCLVLLYALKMNKTLSITFPLMVVALVFIRVGLNYFFTDVELRHLDDILPSFRSNKKTGEDDGEKTVGLLECKHDEFIPGVEGVIFKNRTSITLADGNVLQLNEITDETNDETSETKK